MSENETKFTGGSGHGTNVRIDGPAGADWREASETVEAEIQRKGLTAPRVTPADIEANIVSVQYFTGLEARLGGGFGIVYGDRGGTGPGVERALSLLTFCVLILRNGFTVHGVSACASPENFNAELGRRIARENAEREMWPLMGYALREKLSQQDER